MFEGIAYVYILTNESHTVLYTGVTTDIYKRVRQHKNKAYPKSFTAKYNCNKLICLREFESLCDAFDMEKKVKKRNRDRKRFVINEINLNWDDLYEK